VTITAADLRAALVLLCEHWGKGRYYNSVTGCYCAAGAVAKVKGILTEPPYYNADPEMENELRDILGLDEEVYEWNDASTQAEVVAAFEEVIRRLETE